MRQDASFSKYAQRPETRQAFAQQHRARCINAVKLKCRLSDANPIATTWLMALPQLKPEAYATGWDGADSIESRRAQICAARALYTRRRALEAFLEMV